MKFERTGNPIKSLDIGRRKNALPIIAVKYVINGNTTEITDPEVVELFLQRFCKLQIPKDPVFGPQVIILVEKRILEKIKYRENLTIFEYAGKSLLHNDNLYLAPTLKEINDKGYGYLQREEEKDKIRREKKRKEKEKINTYYGEIINTTNKGLHYR